MKLKCVCFLLLVILLQVMIWTCSARPIYKAIDDDDRMGKRTEDSQYTKQPKEAKQPSSSEGIKETARLSLGGVKHELKKARQPISPKPLRKRAHIDASNQERQSITPNTMMENAGKCEYSIGNGRSFKNYICPNCKVTVPKDKHHKDTPMTGSPGSRILHSPNDEDPDYLTDNTIDYNERREKQSNIPPYIKTESAIYTPLSKRPRPGETFSPSRHRGRMGHYSPHIPTENTQKGASVFPPRGNPYHGQIDPTMQFTGTRSPQYAPQTADYYDADAAAMMRDSRRFPLNQIPPHYYPEPTTSAMRFPDQWPTQQLPGTPHHYDVNAHMMQDTWGYRYNPLEIPAYYSQMTPATRFTDRLPPQRVLRTPDNHADDSHMIQDNWGYQYNPTGSNLYHDQMTPATGFTGRYPPTQRVPGTPDNHADASYMTRDNGDYRTSSSGFNPYSVPLTPATSFTGRLPWQNLPGTRDNHAYDSPMMQDERGYPFPPVRRYPSGRMTPIEKPDLSYGRFPSMSDSSARNKPYEAQRPESQTRYPNTNQPPEAAMTPIENPNLSAGRFSSMSDSSTGSNPYEAQRPERQTGNPNTYQYPRRYIFGNAPSSLSRQPDSSENSFASPAPTLFEQDPDNSDQTYNAQRGEDLPMQPVIPGNDIATSPQQDESSDEQDRNTITNTHFLSNGIHRLIGSHLKNLGMNLLANAKMKLRRMG